MNKILINLIKSLLLGILVSIGFFCTLGSILKGKDAGIIILGISTISTIIFCTYTIIDEIKKYCDK